MGKLFTDTNKSTALDTPRAYYEKARCMVFIHASPINHSGFIEEITGIDAAIQTHGCILPWAFIYHQRLDADELKRSLSTVLRLYPVVSGRICPLSRREIKQDRYKRHFRIEHNNAGVEFVEALANIKISAVKHRVLGRDTVCGLQDRPPAYFENIDWQRMLNGREPLMKVKLTHTSDGGTILAVSLAHVIADGNSFINFMQAWAAEYANFKNSKEAPSRPFHNRLLLQPSVIEASLLALERQAVCASETNPFSLPTYTDVKEDELDSKELEINVLVAMKAMEREEFERMPGCVLSTVPHASFYGAVHSIMNTMRSLQAERRRFPCLWREMATPILHLRRDQIDSLKAKALEGCSHGEYISSNDVVCALVWTLICELRNRPLPGSEETSFEDSSRLCMAVDLRKNGLEHCLPSSYFGNASWFLNISGVKARRPLDYNPFLQLIREEKADRYREAFISAARRIRHGLLQFRCQKDLLVRTMRSLWSKHLAQWSSKVMMLTDQMQKCDVLVTSWQFPLWDVNFGCGPPKVFHGMIQNAPPFSGILLPEMRHEDGCYIALTVPKSSLLQLKSSPVLKHLVSESHFLV